MTNYSINPKISFAEIKLQDLMESLKDSLDDDFTHITSHRDETIRNYQKVFSPERIAVLTKMEFTDFLLFRNNHHWDSLHRVGGFMVEDMQLLREALTILLDESITIEERINQLRPERTWGKNSMVSHLGTPVLTAILLIMYPEKYGVWNNTSDAGMKLVQLWDKRWDSIPAGQAYCEMNSIYQELASYLNIDLWTLDALWWVAKKRLGSKKVFTKKLF